MKNLFKAKRGTSAVLGVLLLVLLTFTFGIFYFNFVMSKVEFAKNTFASEIGNLILKSFSINSTHIIAFLQNTGTNIIKITGAYINGLLATLYNTAQIAANSVGTIIIQGTFTKGNTYVINLLSMFNTVATFTIEY